MKKIFAFILLLCHMNASMFLPQVAEDDVYDKNGIQEDDINSVLEYFSVALGYDTTPDDEDDDSGQNFHLAKTVEYSYQQQFLIIEQPEFKEITEHNFAEYQQAKIQPVSFDIVTPPPEA